MTLRHSPLSKTSKRQWPKRSSISSDEFAQHTLGAMSLLTGKGISLGLAPAQQILLALTLVTSILTLGTGRSTVLQGAVHLTIFCVFLLLEVAP